MWNFTTWILAPTWVCETISEKIWDQKFLVKKKRFSLGAYLSRMSKPLKTWLWVFSATNNLRNLKLHHIDYGPNMSLWHNFRQNWRPKIFTEKIAIFTRREPGKKCKTLKTCYGFSQQQTTWGMWNFMILITDQIWVCEMISDKIEDQKFLLKK